MVILHIAHIDTNTLGGVQTAVPQMVRAQSAHAQVGFINTCGMEIPGVRMLPWRGAFSPEEYPAPYNNPDIVVFHELYRPAFLRIYPMLKKRGIPYIVIPHGCMTRQAQRQKALKKQVGNLLLFRRFLNGAVSVQYLSDREAEQSAFHVPYLVRGNGVPIPSARKTAFSGGELRLAFIGRLDMHIKGLDLLVEAVELCRQDMEDAGLRLDIYGPDENGTHKKLTEQIQIRGLQTMIHLHPPVFGQEKRQVLLDADCLVLTSRTEGMPVSALEALSYGLPCLVTEGTGMATRLEESGAGFGCETTAEGISRALVRVAQCKGELRRFSEAALVLARANYDENEIARQTVAAYKQMT